MSAPAILAKALFDNFADAPDELSFRKGDVITVLEQDVDGLIGWWLCSLHGRQGIAPGNRMQQIKRRLDEQTSPEASKSFPETLNSSTEAFTFEDIDYDVPRPQEGVDYAVPRGIRSPDYDVPNANNQEACGYQLEQSGVSQKLCNLADNALLSDDINGKLLGIENALDSNAQCGEVYDVPATFLDDNIPQDIYDIPSKVAEEEQSGVATIIPPNHDAPTPSQEICGSENDNQKQSKVCHEPGIYSEIYDIPPVLGDEDNRASFERASKKVNVSLNINKNSVPQESGISVAELDKARKPVNLEGHLSATSSNGKRQSSGSTDSAKLSSDDDDYVDYQDIYGDGREKEINVYDVPVQPISLDQGQNVGGGPTPKRTQVSILQRINMSAVKELKLDPSAALQRLAKLEQAVNVTANKLLSFVTTSWRNPNVLKPQLADIRDIAGKAKVALRLLTEFGLSSLVNARRLPSQELSGRLSRAIEPLLEAYYSVKLALQRLDDQDWRVPLDKANNTHDDLDLIMVHIRPVPENSQNLAAIIRTAATTLYNAPVRRSKEDQALTKSVESKTKQEEIQEPSNEEIQLTLIKAVVKDAVDANFKPRSNGGKWSPTTVRRVCGMDTPRNSAGYDGGYDENIAPNLPSRLQASNDKIKDASSGDESKSPPPPPQRKDSSEKCQHLRQKSIDKFPADTSGPPPKPKLDRKNTSRKSYKTPLFSDHNRDKGNIIRREQKATESEPTTPRRKCNSDPTQLHDHQNKEAEDRSIQSLDKNKVVTLMKQTTVHVSDSDLPQSLRQSSDVQSSALQFEEKDNSGFAFVDLVDKPLQHRPLSNFIKGDSASNGFMVSLNDRELLEFYKYEIDAQLFVLSEAIKGFFAVVDKNESPKVFVSNSKFIVLSAHKFVYIGDTLSKRIKHSDLRSQVMAVTNKLSNCIKILVSATKSAALQYPASNAMKEMSDAVVVVNNVAVELYQIVKKTTKAS